MRSIERLNVSEQWFSGPLKPFFHPIDSVDDNFEEKACQYNDLLAALESFSITASYSRKVLNGLSKFITI